MRRGLCILVFGVSGVGKTTACEAYAARHPDVICLRASQLLTEETAASAEALRTARAGQIAYNQELLGFALARHRTGRWDAMVIVDGHAIIDNDVELVRVPCDAVAAMEPNGLILLEAPADEIIKRRYDVARHRPLRTLEAIKLELETERDTVESYANELEIPLVRLNATGEFSLDDAIASLELEVRRHME